MTTVSKLLSNDMFNEIYDTSKDQYDECMQYYIRRQYKQCLETLLEYDLIKTEQGNRLFINCCYKIPSFDILGRSFKSILDTSFSVHKWEEYIIQLNMNELKDIAIANRILHCSYKWLLWTQSDKDPTIVETYLQFVETVLFRFLKDGNKQVDALYELILFYINEVKIKLLNGSRSITLYTNMCERYPLISSILSEKSVLGPTYEECIKSKLKPKILLSKTKRMDMSHDINNEQHSNIEREENMDIREPEPIINHIIEESHNNNTDNYKNKVSITATSTSSTNLKGMIYQYKKLTYYYLQVLKNSPYKKFLIIGLLFILLTIYKSRKHIKRISNLTRKLISASLSVLDQY